MGLCDDPVVSDHSGRIEQNVGVRPFGVVQEKGACENFSR